MMGRYIMWERNFTAFILCSFPVILETCFYGVRLWKLMGFDLLSLLSEPTTNFAISLIQTLVINDSKVISERNNLVDALTKLEARPGSPESLQQLVEIVKKSMNAFGLSLWAVEKGDNKTPRDKKATGFPGSGREDYTTNLWNQILLVFIRKCSIEQMFFQTIC